MNHEAAPSCGCALFYFQNRGPSAVRSASADTMYYGLAAFQPRRQTGLCNSTATMYVAVCECVLVLVSYSYPVSIGHMRIIRKQELTSRDDQNVAH